MIIFLNYRRNITTKLDSKEIKEKLMELVDEERPLYRRMGVNYANKSFCGIINDKEFKISKVISYGNPLLPILTGKIIEGDGNTKVVLFMRLSIFVQIEVLLFISVAFYMTFVSRWIIPVLIITITHLCACIIFYIESKGTLKIIERLL